MRDACARFGHPERAFETVHVAGTNGKGSVCAMVESIARGAGPARRGSYTSPHLCRFAERIRHRRRAARRRALAATLERALDGAPELSFFETATLAAFLAFREASVDLAVVEVGIGGRLDATNVLPRPRAAAITRIALDHTDRLGTTLVDIAREKAGIAKPGLDIVLGPMPADVRAAIDEVARAHGATTTRRRRRRVAGAASGSTASTRETTRASPRRLGDAHRRVARRRSSEGSPSVRWPGRLERIERPTARPARRRPQPRRRRGPRAPPALARASRPTRSRSSSAPSATRTGPRCSTRSRPSPAAASTSRRRAARAGDRPGRARRAPRRASSRPRSRTRSRARARRAGAPRLVVVVAGSLVLVGEARALLLGLPRDPPVAL